MAEQDRLQLIGQAFALLADTESARFSRELGRVLAVLERDLLGLVAGVREGKRGILSRAGRLLMLRRELREALTEAGYSSLVTRASLDAVERMAVAAQSYQLIKASAKLGQPLPARLTVLARLMRADLLGVGDQLALAVWRSAVTSLYSDRPASVIVSALAKAIEKSRAQAQTLFDTQVSIVGRQIVSSAPMLPGQAYLYVGPIDGVVREWCLGQAGMVRTQPAIEALDNGQLPNPFVTGGGYNCRHSWIAVSDPALVALADTGTRADGFAERVESARAFKALKRSLRRAA